MQMQVAIQGTWDLCVLDTVGAESAAEVKQTVRSVSVLETMGQETCLGLCCESFLRACTEPDKD